VLFLNASDLTLVTLSLLSTRMPVVPCACPVVSGPDLRINELTLTVGASMVTLTVVILILLATGDA
jgi:hypothetical protein